jgi:hypothetical protein
LQNCSLTHSPAESAEVEFDVLELLSICQLAQQQLDLDLAQQSHRYRPLTLRAFVCSLRSLGIAAAAVERLHAATRRSRPCAASSSS